MVRITAAVAIFALATPASANAIQDALKKIGPAYMCGPHYEYREALAALRYELVKVGLTELLADHAINGVRRAAEANAKTRESLTAEDCAAKYGRAG